MLKKRVYGIITVAKSDMLFLLMYCCLLLLLFISPSYTGGRSAEDITAFVTAEAGVNVKVKKEISHVVELSPSNFDEIVLDSNKNVLVEFFAPCESVRVLLVYSQQLKCHLLYCSLSIL